VSFVIRCWVDDEFFQSSLVSTSAQLQASREHQQHDPTGSRKNTKDPKTDHHLPIMHLLTLSVLFHKVKGLALRTNPFIATTGRFAGRVL